MIRADVNPVVGVLKPYKPGDFNLPGEAPFGEFSLLEVVGLARVTGDHFELLSIIARRPGEGACSRFLGLLQVNYRVVTVWEVWNPRLEQMLRRRGYLAIVDQAPGGEVSSGRRWTRP